MSDKPFDWDAFNKVLQGSSNISSGARKDIEKAIDAGKGKIPPVVEVGQLWSHYGILAQLQAAPRNAGYFLANVEGFSPGYPADDLHETAQAAVAKCEFVAKSLREYIANGGKL